MTHTLVSSATREVILGFDRPFVLIGERINPTGRKLLAEEMRSGDFSRVERDALAQVEAGAHMLDVNAGIPLADEPAILAWTVQLVQSLVDVPLSIDSSIIEALEAGLAVYRGKALVNSVTGEEERMERVLPLIRKYGAAVVAISNDDSGISEDPDVRFAVAKRIVERAADHGIPRSDIVVDPLVMPIGAMRTAGQQVFRLVRRLHEELGVNTTCGASNVSFGLPNREGVNAAFLPMAIASGLTSAITNPLSDGVRAAIMAADVLMGNDPDAGRWIRVNRPPTPEAGMGSGPDGTAGIGERGRRVNRRALAPAGGGWATGGGLGRRFGHRRRFCRGFCRAAQRRDQRSGSARHLHAVRTARPLRGRNDGPRCRPRPRRGSRFRLRRARAVRPLPGPARRGRVPEARDHVQRYASLRRPARMRPSSIDCADWPQTGASVAGPRSTATCSWTCRRRARSTGRSSARASPFAISSSIPSCGCSRWTLSGPPWRHPAATLRASSPRSCASGVSMA